MVYAVKSGIQNVSIRPVDARPLSRSEVPKVNAHVAERMAHVRGVITPLQGYDPQDKKWETAHFIADPTIGKEVLTHFRYDLGMKDRERFVEFVGEHSILTASTKESHSKIHKDYHTFFSTIFNSEKFIQSLQANLKVYLEKYKDNHAPISLTTLVSELVTVVIQNTVNGYPHEISKPAYWVGQFLGVGEDQLKTVEEIDSIVAAHPKEDKSTNNSWYARPVSFITNAAKAIFMNYTLDRHVEKIYKEGVEGNQTFPKHLKEQGHTEEEIKANIKTSFFAQETMRNLLLFLLYEYAKDSKLQKDDREVIEECQLDDSAALPEEIERRILVALHEYPTGGATRVADTPTLISWEELGEIHEYYIPAGELIVYSPFAASHCPSVWEEVFKGEPGKYESFDMQKLRQLSHLPFGSGQHKCPAAKFVVPVMRMIVCEILSTCRIALVDQNHALKLAISTTLQPDSDIKVLFNMVGAPLWAEVWQF